MSNPNNGKIIEGTEDFFNGPMLLPTGASNGKQFSALLNTILERLANHNHSGDNSKPATLPKTIEQTFPDATNLIVADGDMFKLTAKLESISPSTSNVSFYYMDGDPTPISPDKWIRFYPQYTVVNTPALDTIEITGLIRGDIRIKVSV